MLTSLFTLIASAYINSAQIDINQQPIPTKEVGIEILNINPIPIKHSDVIIALTAKAALVMDVNSNQILFEKNKKMKLPIASLTKLMTAIITIEEIENLDDIAVVSSHASQTPGSKIWLSNGEKMSYRSLLYALLIQSGNDAAVTLAENVGESEELFVQEMNNKALALGMKNTHYINSHGLDDYETNESTVEDLSILASYALKQQLIRTIINIQSVDIYSTNGTVHHLTTTNKLLGTDPEIKGMKTGSTIKAGECFISLAENEFGNEIITIILNSQSRFTETSNLKNKIWTSYVW